MHEQIKAESFRHLVMNPGIRAFSHKIITESYVACVPGDAGAMQDLMERAFAMLTASQADEQRFQAAVKVLLTQVFKKQDPDFWFNRVYRHYKRDFKPQHRFLGLKPWLVGERVLDFGCGC
jgi:hypothetical protein